MLSIHKYTNKYEPKVMCEPFYKENQLTKCLVFKTKFIFNIIFIKKKFLNQILSKSKYIGTTINSIKKINFIVE